MRRVKNPRDSEAWREFDVIYRPMLGRFARARGLGHADAEDITQHCMTAIQAHIKGFAYDPRKGKFKGWLRTMVNNRVRDMQRRPRCGQAKTGQLERVKGREQSPEEMFDRIWLREHLLHCLEQIRKEVKTSTLEAFRCYVLEERPIEEVCRSLDMNPNEVHLSKWRIATKLRKRLARLLDDAE